MSGPGASVTSEFPDKQRITCKNKINKDSDTSIRVREIIQELDNPSKRKKGDSIPNEEKHNKKTPPPFKNREYYIGDTNEKTDKSTNIEQPQINIW